jgi:hypothetical protein
MSISSAHLLRREWLLAGASGLVGGLLGRYLASNQAWAQSNPPTNKVPAKAKACIVLWLNGGPSHIDTFDPKVDKDVAGPGKRIKTRIKNVEFNEHLPMLADRAHRLTVIRSMTSKEGNHDRARYLLHTGYAPTPTAHHPSFGAWVSSELGGKSSALPNFVSLGGPSGDGGFLGVQYAPLVVKKAGQLPQDVQRANGISEQRMDARLKALAEMNRHFSQQTNHDPHVLGQQAVVEQAARLMRAEHLKAFGLEDESDKVVQSYGDNNFGKGCLVARRLVEKGVRFVEVTLDGWDTHDNNFERIAVLNKKLDQGYSALLDDLAQRKMLDSTMIVCLGEFGRSPKITAREGRGHHPQVWSAVLAGAGLRAGVVHGQSDDRGNKVIQDPVTVPDLFATMATLMGMDSAKVHYTNGGRPIAMTDHGKAVQGIMS